MGISEAPTASLEKNTGFPLHGDLGQECPGFCILNDGSQGNLDDFVLTGSSKAALFSPAAAMARLHMAVVLQVKQGPELAVSPEDDMAATASVAPIRTSLGDKFLSTQMGTPGTAIPRLAKNLDVINKIGI